MPRLLLLTTILCFSFVNNSWAVDPQPKSDSKEKVEGIRNSGGAIKVEKKTAVPAEALKKDATTPEAAPTTPVAAPVTETPMETAPAAPAATTSSNSGSHLFGVHASVGLPHPVNFGLNYVHPSHAFSAELSTGSFDQKVDDVDIKLMNTELALRWHPWEGAFFIGALVGNQKITAKKSEVVTNGVVTATVTGDAEVTANYVTPHLGWIWGQDDGGFFISFDIGVQSPSGVKTTFTSDVPAALQGEAEYVDLEKKVKDEGDKFGKMTLPYMSLLKIGWLF